MINWTLLHQYLKVFSEIRHNLFCFIQNLPLFQCHIPAFSPITLFYEMRNKRNTASIGYIYMLHPLATKVE